LAVSRQPWNQLEAALPRWCADLRAIPSSPSDSATYAVRQFVDSNIRPWLDESAPLFWQAMARTDRVRDSLVRYALVELETEIRRRGKDKNELPSNRTVEHIFPQSYTADNVQDFFKTADVDEATAKSVTYALGNLALLTTNENSVAGSRVYKKKLQEPYPITSFRLTKQLAIDMHLGKNAAINEVIEEFGLLPVQEWNASELRKREAKLQKLMLARWPLLPGPR
jgi:hypothetical protein